MSFETMPTIYQVEHLHQPDGWLSPGYLEVGGDGTIHRVLRDGKGRGDVVTLTGYGVPGLTNLHSHAFQRGLAGRTEFVSGRRAKDDLWTWREDMYRFADRLTPEDYEAIGALTYLEMLQFGTTAVCEFHYIHHQSGGTPYDSTTEMADRLIAAADRTGIGLTILPVLYAHGGIGKPAERAQRRFVNAVDDYLALVGELRRRRRTRPALEVGTALHSLRAVTPDEVRATLEGVDGIDDAAKIHIHVSETAREVAEIEAALGARPVQWLLDHVDLNERWCLVHATHIDASERARTAASGAVVGLCPLTEAMLGDGLFPLVAYTRARGCWGIGTDSHCSTSSLAELRMLECGQRLERGRRNVVARPDAGQDAHTGRVLFDSALAGGERASGHGGGALLPGRRADLVVLDPDSHTLLAHGPETALDAWVLGGTQNPVRDVMVAGKWVIRDGRHAQDVAIRDEYRKAMARLTR